MMKTRIILCLGVLLTLWSCRTPSATTPSPTVEEDTVIIETFTIKPGSEPEDNIPSLTGQETKYVCSISTWDMPGSERTYYHLASIQYFPEDLVKQANGREQRWTFVVTNPSMALSEGYGEYESVAQLAFCTLPDVEGIEEEMIFRLSNINPATGHGKLPSDDNQDDWHIYAEHTVVSDTTDE